MAQSKRLAVIDIGSHSIRLVVFDGLRRAPLALYNEKMLCALGKGLEKTGRLNPDGVGKAHAEIDRFLGLTAMMGIKDVTILSTAAARDAEDGPEFVAAIEQRHGIPVQVLSGNREAEYAGLAIVSSMYRPQGIAGDLGGGSLELVSVEDDHLCDHTTLPLGVLRLSDASGGDVATARAHASSRIRNIPWLKQVPHERFYAVGGSFRALAKMYMAMTDYPLTVLHGYEMPAKDMLPLIRRIASLPVDKIAEMPGVPSRRAGNLPYAAVVLRELIEHIDVKTLVFSASGIREGYLFDRLPEGERGEDGLLASCRDLLGRKSPFETYGEELFAWMGPLFENESPEEARLRHAACLLGGIASRIHPDHRAEWAFHRVLYSSIIGLTHAERVFLATALYHRYLFDEAIPYPAAPLLDAHGRKRARRVGTAARLAYSLTAGATGVLASCPVTLKGKEAHVAIDEAHGMLMGEEVRKRLDRLNQLW